MVINEVKWQKEIVIAIGKITFQVTLVVCVTPI